MISCSALASVHILSHCHYRQAAESLSQSLASAQLQSVGEISERSDPSRHHLQLSQSRLFSQSLLSAGQLEVLASLRLTLAALSQSSDPLSVCGGSGCFSLTSLASHKGLLHSSVASLPCWCSGGCRKINFKFLASLRYLSAIFVIEGSQ